MKILMILASKDFRDEEYSFPREVFEREKMTVITASTEKVSVGRFGLRVSIDKQLHEIFAKDFDVVFWVGGGGCFAFQENKEAKRIAREFLEQEKFIAAICAAPRLLLAWGVLKGKKMTGWNGDGALESLAAKGGAVYTGNDVVRDGKFLTADGPDSARKAGEMLLEMLF